MDLRRRGSWLVVAVAVLGAGAVAGVLFAGPVFIENPRWQGLPLPPAPTPTLVDATPSGREKTDQFANIFQLVLNMFYVALAILVVVLIVRALARMQVRLGERRTDSLPSLRTARAPDGDGGVIEAPVVRRGIARALAALDEERDPSDAVVQAWLGFEDAAVNVGVGRSAHETPTEYAVRIIARFDADRAAAEELVRVYEDVRFSGRRGDAAAVATARRCLLTLQASWNDTAPVVRR